MDHTTSMLLKPGNKWVFPRQKVTNDNIVKYTIEIVTIDMGEAHYTEITGNTETLGSFVFDADIAYENSKVKYLQAVFFNEAGQIVGVTKYDTSLKATEAVADFTKKNGIIM